MTNVNGTVTNSGNSQANTMLGLLTNMNNNNNNNNNSNIPSNSIPLIVPSIPSIPQPSPIQIVHSNSQNLRSRADSQITSSTSRPRQIHKKCHFNHQNFQ